MEFIPGETLQEKLNRVGPLDVPETLRIGRQIAEVLAAAHATDLIHRDIKPSNVLLEGGQHKVKITDFGLARAADDASLSQSGFIAGTPMYMAPEQVQGETLDQRADLFSLGSVLYQMVAGRPPFRANSTVAVLKRVAEDRPRAIREIIPETPQWLCDIIAKLHAKDPKERYQSAREVADVLADCEAQLKAHSKLKDYSRIPRRTDCQSVPRPRFRIGRWTVAAAVLLLLLGGLGFTEATGVTNVRSTVIRLFSPEGTLEVQVDDPGVSVQIDGSDLVITGAGAKAIRLKPGSYTVEARKDGKIVSRELVTVTKNGKQIVRVHQEPVTVPKTDARQWEKSVAALPPAEQVEAVARRQKELNPGFNGSLTPTIENGVVTGLVFQGDDHVADISPVRALAGLTRLDCMGLNPDVTNSKSEVYDLAPLRGMKLTRLNLNFTQVADLSGLRGMPLKELHISVTRVADLSPLRGMPLKDLEMNDTPVADLTPLKGMQLESLGLRNTQVTDLSPLHGMPLESLACSSTGVADLKPLEGMPLKGLEIYRTRVADLAPLRGMPLLTLKTEFTAVTDLSPLKGMPLTGLFLHSTSVSDARLADLAGLDKLTSLDLRTTKVTAKGVEGLAKALPKCKIDWNGGVIEPTASVDPDRRAAEYVLSIGGRVCINGDTEVRAMAELPQEPFRLTIVNLNGNKRVTDAGLAAFESCTNLTSLFMHDCAQVTDPGFAHFKSCKGLAGIDLWGVSLTDAGLAHLKGNKKLTSLCLVGTQVTDDGLAYLKECTSLTVFDLRGSPVTDAGLAHLKDCKNLTYLHLDGTKITDAGLAYLKDKNLTWLYLDGTKITDAGLAHLKDCKSLTQLWVRGVRVGDVGLANLKDCKDLTTLALAGTAITDAGLAHLKGSKKLAILNLAGTQVTDAGLAHLAGLNALTGLWIHDTGITDLTPLQGMPLEEIRLTPKNITKGLDILRDMKSLKTIGIGDQAWPAAEFWERYDKGEFKE
jgi:Leucine-rich repeat (LRR) protein